MIKLGFGMPAFNSDEIIIPALMAQGVTEEDAYNYSAIGCVEVGVPGKWGYRCTGMSYLNFPKTLMIALNNGVDLTTGKLRIGDRLRGRARRGDPSNAVESAEIRQRRRLCG